MKKALYILVCILLLISCGMTDRAELNDENIGVFVTMKDYIVANSDSIKWIVRDVNGQYRITYTRENADAAAKNENADVFFSTIHCIGAVYADRYKLFYTKNLHKHRYVSDELYQKDVYRNELLKRFDAKQMVVNFVFFQECSPDLFGRRLLTDCGFVYSPDIDLSDLTREELSVFGIAGVKATGFADWYFYGLRGSLL